LARQLEATYVRIDTIEQAVRGSRNFSGAIYDVGYCVGNSVAEENLRLGRNVIADAVNPVQIARDAWRAVASRAGARAVEIEGLAAPTWNDVETREYQPWDRERLVIDTANRRIEQGLAELNAVLSQDKI
jgi:predicted kinase